MPRTLFERHNGFWTSDRKKSLLLSIVLLTVALVIQMKAGTISYQRAITAPYSNDLFLDNLPVVPLDFIIGQGAMLLWIGMAVYAALRPRFLLFGFKAVALFIITRAFFINLTHLGIYPEHNDFDPGRLGYKVYSLFNFQGNYFFSGHTGLPFLAALIFWHHKRWRNFFLIATVVFGASALLAHVHYSIDVFAAPFITYSIFKIAERLFPEDYALLASAEDIDKESLV